MPLQLSTNEFGSTFGTLIGAAGAQRHRRRAYGRACVCVCTRQKPSDFGVLAACRELGAHRTQSRSCAQHFDVATSQYHLTFHLLSTILNSTRRLFVICLDSLSAHIPLSLSSVRLSASFKTHSRHYSSLRSPCRRPSKTPPLLYTLFRRAPQQQPYFSPVSFYTNSSISAARPISLFLPSFSSTLRF